MLSFRRWRKNAGFAGEVAVVTMKNEGGGSPGVAVWHPERAGEAAGAAARELAAGLTAMLSRPVAAAPIPRSGAIGS